MLLVLNLLKFRHNARKHWSISLTIPEDKNFIRSPIEYLYFLQLTRTHILFIFNFNSSIIELDGDTRLKTRL